jgi:hypothetical protein
MHLICSFDKLDTKDKTTSGLQKNKKKASETQSETSCTSCRNRNERKVQKKSRINGVRNGRER